MDKTDKNVERLRYEDVYTRFHDVVNRVPEYGSVSMRPFLRAPYLFYEQCITSLVNENCTVLELGSGSGLNTRVLLDTGAKVIATDIAESATALLLKTFGDEYKRFSAITADMERLPFPDSVFDVVACAGSLSYGNPEFVFSEISRVLSPGGKFICVDSLNHNLIYRLNRFRHYSNGHRTISTLRNMPTIETLSAFENIFSHVNIRYFGSITYAMPVVAAIIGDDRSATVSNWVDRYFKVRRSAFKFVLTADGLVK